MLQANIVGSIHDEIIGFINCTIHSSCTMALLSAQPLTKMSTPEGRGRPADA
jgi:hypothetical protein